MNNFKFKIQKINRLEKAKTIVLDGVLLNGLLKTGSSAKLMSNEITNIVIKGVVLGEMKLKSSQEISLVIDLAKSSNINQLKEGDFLVGN